MTRNVVLVLSLALLVLAGCARSAPESRAPLTERQRDSILARQPLPGAGVVGRALESSDDAAERARAMDAQLDSLAR
jgi:hypothetical protein